MEEADTIKPFRPYDLLDKFDRWVSHLVYEVWQYMYMCI